MTTAQVSRGRLFPIPPTARSRRRAAARAAGVALLGTAAPRYWHSLYRTAGWARQHPLGMLAAVAVVPLLLPAGWLLRPALLLLLTAGLLSARDLARTDRAPVREWVTARRVALWTCSSVILLAVLGTALPGPLALWLALGAVAGIVAARRPVELIGSAWWAHRRLVAALTAARIIPAEKPGARPVSLSYLGRPAVDEHGTAVTVRLPPGVTWQTARDRAAELASALDVPLARLHVRHDPDQPESVVTLHVGNDLDPRRPATPSPVAEAPRTHAGDPLRIGLDDRHRPVVLPTFEHNLLIAGLPGYGKTSTVRVELLHTLLDPDARVLLLDGKGSRRDYAACLPLLDGYVTGLSDDAPDELADLLDRALAEVRRRNGTDEPDGGWPRLLLLLEEVQDVRAAADARQAERIDTTLGRYVRQGRAVNCRLIVSTQRPSVDDLPSGVRNLVDQRVVLACRNPEDAKLALGTAPHGLRLPGRPGRAIVATPAGLTPATLDLLDQQAWTDGIARAAALRPAPAAAPIVLAKHEPPARPVPPTAAAALTVLADRTPRTATELWAALDGHPDRTGSPVRLGQQLARDAAAGAPLVQVTIGKGKGWTVGAGYRTPDLTPARTHGGGPEGPDRAGTALAVGSTLAGAA